MLTDSLLDQPVGLTEFSIVQIPGKKELLAYAPEELQRINRIKARLAPFLRQGMAVPLGFDTARHVPLETKVTVLRLTSRTSQLV